MTPLFGAGRSRDYPADVPEQPEYDVHQARAAWAQLLLSGGLVSSVSLRARWGVKRSRVSALLADPGFPDPVEEHGGTRLWLAAEVDAWMRRRLAEAGRPGPKPRHVDHDEGR